jgi:hypothetical protein
MLLDGRLIVAPTSFYVLIDLQEQHFLGRYSTTGERGRSPLQGFSLKNIGYRTGLIKKGDKMSPFKGILRNKIN